MHLTNYSINKHSAKFDHSEERDQGSKRTIQYFNRWLVNNGYNASELWAKINVSVKENKIKDVWYKLRFNAQSVGTAVGF